jgi:predicted nucleic acid-binding protein
LGKARSPVWTSSFVLDETFTLLARRSSYPFAAAVGFFRELADQQVSFTDCVSFALMRRYRLMRVFTFDRHFAAAGFTVWPSGR